MSYRHPLILFSLLLCVASLALAAEWPQFRGVGRDGTSAETGLLQQWPDGGPKLLWSVDKVGDGYSQPAVTKDAIYVTGMLDGNKGYCTAYDLAGRQKWRTAYGTEWTGGYKGTRGGPTVAGDRVFVTSACGDVACLRTADGTVVWKQNFFTTYGASGNAWGYCESVLVDGDHVICTPSGKKATMVALDAKTGAELWTVLVMQDAQNADDSSYGSPILITRGGTRLIITSTSHHIIGVNADSGKLLWQFDYHNIHGQHPAAPFYADGMLVVSSGDGMGAVMLKLNDDGTAVTEGWRQKKLDIHFASGVLVAGSIYATGHGNGGKLLCVDLATGAIRWEDQGVGKGSVTLADGRLYCYAENGTVGLALPSPDGFKLISSFKITQGTGEQWAHPAISNGRLYIRHGNSLMAYDIAAAKPQRGAVD